MLMAPGTAANRNSFSGGVLVNKVWEFIKKSFPLGLFRQPLLKFVVETISKKIYGVNKLR